MKKVLKNQKGFTLFELLFVPAIITVVLAIVASFWLSISLITSGVKLANGHCGTTYGLEPLANGNLFCPKKKEETNGR